jgi:hypothetical protein
MAFVEDNSQYLADFGVVCVSGGVTFTALFDQPDTDFNVGNATFQSREYKITYLTSAVNLKTADVVIVSGANYFLRNYPNTVDDGTWCEAILSKS